MSSFVAASVGSDRAAGVRGMQALDLLRDDGRPCLRLDLMISVFGKTRIMIGFELESFATSLMKLN